MMPSIVSRPSRGTSAYPDCETVRLTNLQWVEEMDLIRETQSPYSKIPGASGRPTPRERQHNVIMKGTKAIRDRILRYKK